MISSASWRCTAEKYRSIRTAINTHSSDVYRKLLMVRTVQFKTKLAIMIIAYSAAKNVIWYALSD